MLSSLARIIGLASILTCLVTIASFALFAVSQTSTASAHQQGVLNGETPTSRSGPEHKSSLRRTVDDASNAITSPFSGVTSGTHSEWTLRIVRLLLALAVYGFGLGFLARLIRVRV